MAPEAFVGGLIDLVVDGDPSQSTWPPAAST
jgi:hypothetical protein